MSKKGHGSGYENTQPSLDVYRPVIGINNEHMRRLQGRLQRSHLFAPSSIQESLRPAATLRASLIKQGELKQLYRAIGITVTTQDMDQLSEFISQGISAADLSTGFREATPPVPLLPSAVHPPPSEKTTKKILKIAAYPPILTERKIAQNAIRVFFGLSPEEMPARIWLSDTFVTPVHLARAVNPSQLKVVEHLNALLNHQDRPLFEEGILPEAVRLGPVKSDIIQVSI